MLYSVESFVAMLEEDKLTVEEVLGFGYTDHRIMEVNISRDIDHRLIRELISQVTTKEQFIIDLEDVLMEDLATKELASEMTWDYMDTALTFYLSYDERVKFYEDYSLLVYDFLEATELYYPLEYFFIDDLGLLELN